MLDVDRQVTNQKPRDRRTVSFLRALCPFSNLNPFLATAQMEGKACVIKTRTFHSSDMSSIFVSYHRICSPLFVSASHIFPYLQVESVDSILFEQLHSSWSLQSGPQPGTCWLQFKVEFKFRSPLYNSVRLPTPPSLFLIHVCLYCDQFFSNVSSLLQVCR